MVTHKSKYLVRHLTHHLILTFFVLTLLLIGNNQLHLSFFQIACASLTIVLFHYGIDQGKMIVSKKQSGQPLYSLYLFVIDQLLHLATIMLVCAFFLNVDFPAYFNRLTAVVEKGIPLQASPVSVLLFLIIMLIVATTVSGHFIRFLVGMIPDRLSLSEGKYVLTNEKTGPDATRNMPSIQEKYTYLINKKSDRTRGVIIGYFERLLVMVLIVIGAYSGIAFIAAAKSIARFKQMDDRDFAEYFLLGTLASMFIGVVCGIVVKFILSRTS
ncbi:hypothetical protein GCM10007968_10990 [Sporolactobacillus putidus]|uniref:DUF3307 domain-containing protein n=2 Tax=Sporolactobacillus putidus TaxID=492735 RepID=A0A917S0B3_9BACL|nr:hypothetical protein GCM10007968_10990 [Sporolactobacillus putidus]